MAVQCYFINCCLLLFLNIMHIKLLFLLLIFFSSQVQAIDAELAQNIEAEIALENIVNESSYQQICHKHTQQISLLFDKFISLRGDISRLYFFCEAQYNNQLTRKQRRMSEIWDIKDPVSIVECKREKSRKSQNIESNHYIINRC
jgi:endonuclease I